MLTERPWRRRPVVAGVMASGAMLVGLLAWVPANAAGAESSGAQVQAEPSIELVIESRTPVEGGRSFGSVGSYERLRGYAEGELDPSHPANSGIVNLDKAPTNERGNVEYRVDVEIHRPVEMDRGNGTLLYDVVNRGRQRVISNSYNGDSLLYKEGFTLVWSGWQGDVASTGTNLVGEFPIATNDGEPIVGLVREEFVDRGTGTWTGALPYRAATLDETQASLTVREREQDPRQPIDSWRYLNDGQIEVTHPGAPFSSGAIYEFIYPAVDPVVNGIGFAATRDVNSYLRSGSEDSAGNDNPLGVDTIRDTLAIGISQSGRYLRNFLHEGFNEDLAGQRVFDGVMPIIAGSRKVWLNYEFALTGWWSKQHEQHLQRGSQFPFAYPTVRDPLTGQVDGILAKCTATDTCPKIVHVDGEFEVWGARGSLLVSDGHPDRPKDLKQPSNVRLYMVAGTPHGGANSIVPSTMDPGICQQVNSPLGNGAVTRALLLHLHSWVVDGAEPPKSRYGSVSRQTLVPSDQENTRFPEIPGVTYNGAYNYLHVTDYEAMPPAIGAEYGVRVPRVDRDGHSLAGIRLPAIEAPIATYAGWNLRSAGNAEGEVCSSRGSFIPLADTKAERLESGDPRKSIEERYDSHDDYVKQFSKAADKLVREGFLLPEDAAAMVAEAAALPFPLAASDDAGEQENGLTVPAEYAGQPG